MLSQHHIHRIFDALKNILEQLKPCEELAFYELRIREGGLYVKGIVNKKPSTQKLMHRWYASMQWFVVQ
jgi:hypothetical protein